jgi:photosystem II 22kDa protein
MLLCFAELFVGRWAMIGFAASIIGEKLTGKGPVGQLGLPLDLPVSPVNVGFGLAIWVGFFLAAAIGFGNYGQTEGDEEIY